MTTSLIRRAAVFAGIVALAISLVGQTTVANEHRGSLQGRIVNLENRVGVLESAPDSDTLAELDCMDGDTIVFDGIDWECVTPDGVAGMKTVFVTSGAHNGDLVTAGGGVVGFGLQSADNFCNAHARQGVVPPGDYIAWLSTATKDAKDRLPDNDDGYVLADGMTVIATSKADLLDGALLHAIDQDEAAGHTFNSVSIWTATTTAGEYFTDAAFPITDCNAWESGGGGVVLGLRGLNNNASAPARWTFDSVTECFSPAHIYCFER